MALEVDVDEGALIDGAHAGIAGRLDAIETALEAAAKEASSDV